MTIFAFFNMSGGVGKTTLSMNIAYHLKKLKLRTLAIDMDPQASLTTFLGVDPFSLEQTIYDSLMDSEVPLLIQKTEWYDLVPANLHLAKAEMLLTAEFRREYRLADALKQLESQYKTIIIDGPPSLGLLSINCLVAADYLLVPLSTNYKAVEATMGLLRVSIELAQKVNPTLRVMGLVPTMFDTRTSSSRRAKDAINEIAGQLNMPIFEDLMVFDPVPMRTAISDAQEAHQPLAVFDSKNDSLKVMKKIANEMKSKVSK